MQCNQSVSTSYMYTVSELTSGESSQLNLGVLLRRELEPERPETRVLQFLLSHGSYPGADPGEVKWVNFHPPFF